MSSVFSKWSPIVAWAGLPPEPPFCRLEAVMSSAGGHAPPAQLPTAFEKRFRACEIGSESLAPRASGLRGCTKPQRISAASRLRQLCERSTELFQYNV